MWSLSWRLYECVNYWMWKIYSICIQGKWRIKKITQHLVRHCWADEQKQPLNHVTGNTALAGTHIGDDNAKQQTSQAQWGILPAMRVCP